MAKDRTGKGNRRDPEREKLWRDRLSAWEASGLTAREFCRERELSENSFYAWRRELRRRDLEGQTSRPAARARAAKRPKFVAVELGSAATQEAAIEIVLPDAIRIRVLRHAEQPVIANVLGALRAAASC